MRSTASILILPPGGADLLERLLEAAPAAPRRAPPPRFSTDLPPVRPPVDVFDAIVRQLRRELAMGHDAAWDDARGPDFWIGMLEDLTDRAEIADSPEAWSNLWTQIGALAARVLEVAERKSGIGPASSPDQGERA